MDRKWLVIVISVVVAVAVIFWYWRNWPKEEVKLIETTDQAIQAVTETPKVEVSTNPVEGKFPELNPVEKVNPFKYKNPFE